MAIGSSAIIKSLSKQFQFDYCGISPAKELTEDAKILEQWLKTNKHADMTWMERNFEKRINPSVLMPGAKSVISLLLNYYTPENTTNPKISKYALGTDYHLVIKEKLKLFCETLVQKFGQFEFRYFTDSAPLLEKALARESGLGWIGKNAMLINKSSGSYFFLAEIVCDLTLEYDSPIKDYCGSCTACIDACPTDAILPNRTIESTKCISYQTIEYKGNTIDDSLKSKMENWAFGCDICQDVCPWNRFSKAHQVPEFNPISNWEDMDSNSWLNMDESSFNTIFKTSPIKRTKLEGIKRNVKFLISE